MSIQSATNVLDFRADGADGADTALDEVTEAQRRWLGRLDTAVTVQLRHTLYFLLV